MKNVRYLQAGDNGTVTIGENSLMFYDDGGADGNYTKNMEGYITFVPANEGYAVEVEVKNQVARGRCGCYSGVQLQQSGEVCR